MTDQEQTPESFADFAARRDAEEREAAGLGPEVNHEPKAEVEEKPEAKPAKVKANAEDAETVEDAEEAKPDDEPKADAKPDEEGDDDGKDELPIGVGKRVARANRQRDEARAEAEEAAAKLEQAQAIIKRLREKAGDDLDPVDFESYDAYLAAQEAAKNAKAEPKQPAVNPEFKEALADLREAVEVEDAALWTAATKADIPITAEMVIALADMDDGPSRLRALIADPDGAKEAATGSARAQRRYIRSLDVVAEAQKPEIKRDAAGKFKKQSSLEPPINPVRGSSTGEKPLAKLSTAEFIARRDAEERARSTSWGV